MFTYLPLQRGGDGHTILIIMEVLSGGEWDGHTNVIITDIDFSSLTIYYNSNALVQR
jgi:hypothetical protein